MPYVCANASACDMFRVQRTERDKWQEVHSFEGVSGLLFMVSLPSYDQVRHARVCMCVGVPCACVCVCVCACGLWVCVL